MRMIVSIVIFRWRHSRMGGIYDDGIEEGAVRHDAE